MHPQTLQRLVLMLIAGLLLSMNVASAQKPPFPAQMTVNVYQAPTTAIALDKAYLVYELYVTSFMNMPVTLTSLEVKDGDRTLYVRDNKQNPLHFKPKESRIIYMLVPFNSLNTIPDTISHDFVFTGKFKNKKTDFPSTLPAVAVDKRPALMVGSPLRGGNWIAGNMLSDGTSHRMAALYFDSRPFYPERYAIDFVQTDAQGNTYKGDKHKNTSYYCYNQDVLAVADGQVVAVVDGLPENIPNSNQLAVPLTEDTIAGNYMILDLGNNQYAGFAHLIPGSMKFKVGDSVKRGEVIAKLGNTGNSSEPHLHFQLTNKSSFTKSEGIPYGFERFKLMNKNSTQEVFTNQLPTNDDIIGFD